MKTILALFAHPDDESFGPGGTIVKWTRSGAKIHLITATRGEAAKSSVPGNVADIRTAELKEAADILEISSVEFLDFKDGEIGNNDLVKLGEAFAARIQELRPDTILTFDLNGISGHLDHIAVSSAATQAFKKTSIAERLYYFTVPEKVVPTNEEYFINRPPSRRDEEISERVDISEVWDTKIRAMRSHKSQAHDIDRLLKRWEGQPKLEHFVILESKKTS